MPTHDALTIGELWPVESSARARAFAAIERSLTDVPLNPSVIEALAANVIAAGDASRRPELMTAETHLRALKHQLMTVNLRLVVSVARKYRHPSLSLLDLVQDGNVGLMKAVDRFQYRRGFKKKEDVHVEIREGHLVVFGERTLEKEEKKEGFYRTEREYGRFYRTVPLPDGAGIDDVKATIGDGVLEVTVPLAVKKMAGVQKVEVAAATAPAPKAA
jgi:hypothetical protein